MMHNDGSKSLSVSELRTLLAELPDDARLVPNRVGNLSIVVEGERAGFVDFAAESGNIERWNEIDG